ncbi:MAG: hypothetical protein KF845_03105 [Cyclobacteriaceae bacterium]|nr:hypothetical protein [Cyclobacteriaceae bacterium]
MRSVFFLTILALPFFQSCDTHKKSYLPDAHLTAQQQEQVKQKIIRYVAKMPRRVTGDIKFDTAYDKHYAEQVKRHRLMAYYISKEGGHFFLVTRIAPGIEEKWVATGGRMKFDANGELFEYEEVFRTWKMKKEILDERAMYLFDLLVKGEDLTPYYTATAGFNYIEFPDEHVYFDKPSRSWKSNVYGSVEEMVYESRDSDSLNKK